MFYGKNIREKKETVTNITKHKENNKEETTEGYGANKDLTTQSKSIITEQYKNIEETIDGATYKDSTAQRNNTDNKMDNGFAAQIVIENETRLENVNEGGRHSIDMNADKQNVHGAKNDEYDNQ